jgi:hypothetical protein
MLPAGMITFDCSGGGWWFGNYGRKEAECATCAVRMCSLHEYKYIKITSKGKRMLTQNGNFWGFGTMIHL